MASYPSCHYHCRSPEGRFFVLGAPPLLRRWGQSTSLSAMLRRRFLGGLAAGLASLAVVPRSSRATARPRTPYHLFVLLGGGIDAILSLDPKTRAEVDPSVDLPYDARSIHSTGELAFGPNMVSLAPWAGRAAVLRGVLTSSVAH